MQHFILIIMLGWLSFLCVIRGALAEDSTTKRSLYTAGGITALVITLIYLLCLLFDHLYG